MNDFDSNIKQAFLGNKKLHLILQYGFSVDTGIEFRLYSDKDWTFDLFFVNVFNATHMWERYGQSSKYR